MNIDKINKITIHTEACALAFLLVFKVRRWFLGNLQTEYNRLLYFKSKSVADLEEKVRKMVYSKKRITVTLLKDCALMESDIGDGELHIEVRQKEENYSIRVLAKMQDGIRMFGLTKSVFATTQFLTTELLEPLDENKQDSTINSDILLQEFVNAIFEPVKSKHLGWNTWNKYLQELQIDPRSLRTGTDKDKEVEDKIVIAAKSLGHTITNLLLDWTCYQGSADFSTFWMIHGWTYELTSLLVRFNKIKEAKELFEMTIVGKRFELSNYFDEFKNDFKILLV